MARGGGCCVCEPFSVLLMFSKRALRDETGFCRPSSQYSATQSGECVGKGAREGRLTREEPSGPSLLEGSMMVEDKERWGFPRCRAHNT